MRDIVDALLGVAVLIGLVTLVTAVFGGRVGLVVALRQGRPT